MANTTIVPVESLHRPQRLNSRYRLVAELGSGAFGPVCVAEDVTTGDPVAIRLLPSTAARARGGNVLERISPAIVAASAAHPALVRVLDTGHADNARPFVVIDFIEGRRLSEVLASGLRLDVSTALAMALELGSAIETVHNMGLVHGALRTPNVMVLSDGSVKLMDLELAGLRDAPPMRLAPAGDETPPSQVERPDEPITEKTDIYSFASIVYEMLCGAPPFAASGAAPAKQRPPRPAWPRDRREKIPGSIRRIIEDALSEDPQRRPFMSQLLNALVLKPSTVGSRRRIAIVGAAAVATVGAGALGWGVVTLRTSVVAGPAYSTPSVASTPVQTNRSAGAPSPVGATATPPHETAPPTVSAPTSVSAPPPAVAAPTAVTPPAMTVPAPVRGTTPPPASRTVSTPRRERTPARQAPASPGHESARAPSDAPAAPTHRPVSTADDGYDPAAVIDWVLSDGRR